MLTYAETGEVETVDGFVLGLTLGVSAELRFELGVPRHVSTPTTSTSASRRASRVRRWATAFSLPLPRPELIRGPSATGSKPTSRWPRSGPLHAARWSRRATRRTGKPAPRGAEAQASAERMDRPLRPACTADARIDLLVRQREQYGGGSPRACGRPRTGLPPSSRPSAPTNHPARGAPAQADRRSPGARSAATYGGACSGAAPGGELEEPKFVAGLGCRRRRRLAQHLPIVVATGHRLAPSQPDRALVQRPARAS